MSYTERTQVLLTKAQRAKVERLAQASSRSIGAVIREAIDALGHQPPPKQRQQALTQLFSLQAPVDDWDVLEREIEDAYTGP